MFRFSWSRYGRILFVCFFLGFIYYLLKPVKDALIVTAPDAGAEAIPFVKAWLLFPLSIGLAALFIRMTQSYSLTAIFHFFVASFLLFFVIFAFILYPWRESLQLTRFADELQTYLPAGWKGFCALFRYWTYCLYFILAESWGTIICCVLFWTIVNEFTVLEDAGEFYPALILSGNISAIIAGSVSAYIASLAETLYFPLGTNAWEQILYHQTLLILVSGLAAIQLLHGIDLPNRLKASHDQPRVPVRRALLEVLKNRHLFALSIMTLAFNLFINLSEVVWKDQVGKAYADPFEYSSYMNQVTFAIGIVSSIITLAICGNALKYFGWTATALLTPLIVLTFGAFFYSSILFETQLPFIALIGAYFITLLRSCKYTLYDITKEIAYLPLTSLDRLNGKTAIDGVFARLGKGSGSLTYQALLVFVPTVAACTPYVAAISLVAGGFFVWSIWAASKKIEPAVLSSEVF